MQSFRDSDSFDSDHPNSRSCQRDAASSPPSRLLLGKKNLKKIQHGRDPRRRGVRQGGKRLFRMEDRRRRGKRGKDVGNKKMTGTGEAGEKKRLERKSVLEIVFLLQGIVNSPVLDSRVDFILYHRRVCLGHGVPAQRFVVESAVVLIRVAMRRAESELAAALKTRKTHALVARETPVGVRLLRSSSSSTGRLDLVLSFHLQPRHCSSW